MCFLYKNIAPEFYSQIDGMNMQILVTPVLEYSQNNDDIKECLNSSNSHFPSTLDDVLVNHCHVAATTLH